MPEKEPTIEHEPNPEKKREIPEAEQNFSEKQEETFDIPEEGKKEIRRKKEEEKEKQEAYKEEIEELVALAKEKGFSKAYKKAKKLSNKNNDSIIIDRFHDRLSQEDLND
ncbi:MAG: hypothetical protein ACQEP3_01050 [Patescibacteria group bacterium]